MSRVVLVIAYLAAIVIANLLIVRFGPAVTIPSAFVLIGLDLTVRDALHDSWRGRALWVRMALLIGTGGLLSFLIQADAGRIAAASCVAFVVAGIVDAVAYQALSRRSSGVRVNGSNVAAAAVDSLLFPTLAFGAFLPLVVLGQFVAKVLGGALWWMVLRAVSLRLRAA